MATKEPATDWAHPRDAAGARATECGERVEALLRPGALITQADVTQARDRAQRAVVRAELARQRVLRVLQRRHERDTRRRLEGTSVCGPSELPPLLDECESRPGAGASLRQALDSGAISADRLWPEFLAYGGDVPLTEFDAYLHGAWSMPLRDRRVLEHVWWEHEHLD